MTEIRFAGQLTYSEYRRIQSIFSRKLWFVLGIAVIALTTLNAANNSWRTILTDPYKFVSAGLPIILLWLFVPVLYFVQRYMVQRHWQNSRILHYPVNGVVGDDCVMWNVERFASLNFPWHLILKCRTLDSLAIIHTSSNQAFFLPRYFFKNDSDWKSFRELLASKLPQK
jgi:hypothetical protein